MDFKKYQHVERFGNDEVQGIELGMTYIFPKLDGTNGSAWKDSDGNISAGSRNRELSEGKDNDNSGFYKYIVADDRIKKYLDKYPTHRLYGEFLVPHSITTYKDDAWRKFYVFDVAVDTDEETVEYMHYDEYSGLLEEFDLDYIAPLAKTKNGTYDVFLKALDMSNYLMKSGVGEGIVIKNYSFKNKYNRTVWAKIVTAEFKEKHSKVMGCNELVPTKMTEEKIIDEYLTEALIEKEFAKIVHEQGGWSNKCIPMLLGRVFHELVTEETWNFVKKLKMPTVNFRTLNILATKRIKEVKQELF